MMWKTNNMRYDDYNQEEKQYDDLDEESDKEEQEYVDLEHSTLETSENDEEWRMKK